jgi:hypothetical protein
VTAGLKRRARSLRLAVLLVPAGLCATPLRAQGERLDGIPVGRWLLKPVLFAQLGYDTNPFYEGPEGDADSETSARYALGLDGTLPFRESALRLAYRRERLDYENTELTEDTAEDFSGELGLRLATRDEVKVGADLTRGIADTLRFDPGGEIVFRGEPYDLRLVTTTASREVRGRPGYGIQVSRRDLVFPREEADFNYFEYRGWDFDAEYRHPFGPSTWGTLGYAGKRYRHFCDTVEPGGTPCPDVGVPFREETGDVVYAGFRGALSERSPYRARIGWLDLRYDGTISEGYRGPVGDVDVRVGLSAGTWVAATLTRQVYSSFYLNNNYFVYDAASARAGLGFADRWEVALGATYSRSRYETPAPGSTTGARTDDTLRSEAYANVFLPKRFGIRVVVTDERRSSSDAALDFDRRTFFAGAFFGWL